MPLTIDTVLTGLGHIIKFLQELGKFIGVLFRYKWLQLIILVILIAICTCLAVWYWNLNDRYQQIVYNTLSLNSEATPQRNKGMEAFILSYLETNLNGNIRNNRLHEDFIRNLKTFQNEVKVFLRTEPDDVDGLEVVSTDNVEIITDNNSIGFLFVPTYILRKNFTHAEIESLQDSAGSKPILESIKEDKQLMWDIKFTRQISQSLQKLADTRYVLDKNQNISIESMPSQVYLITKNGINRIFSNKNKNGHAAREYYGNQFPAKTFFPSRPYFWAAFDNKNYFGDENSFADEKVIAGQLDKFMYVSNPYMDLAGNGFVVTLARGIEIEGKVKAVLCVDLSLIRSNKEKATIDFILDEIEKDIDDVGREHVVGEIAGSRITVPGGAPLVNDFRQFLSETKPNDISDVVGNIQVFNQQSGGVVEVSIPVGTIGSDNKVEFVLFKIDLEKFKIKTYWVAVGVFVSFAFLVFFLSYLYGATILRFDDYENAFNQVDEVMYKAPIPYCRLDGNDLIKDANPAFCLILAIDPNDERDLNALRRQTFEELCFDEESRRTYNDVEGKRRRGEKVLPYPLNFRLKSNGFKRLTVISGRFPSSLSGQMPETFGILLDLTDPIHKKYFDGYNGFVFQVD